MLIGKTGGADGRTHSEQLPCCRPEIVGGCAPMASAISAVLCRVVSETTVMKEARDCQGSMINSLKRK